MIINILWLENNVVKMQEKKYTVTLQGAESLQSAFQPFLIYATVKPEFHVFCHTQDSSNTLAQRQKKIHRALVQ